MIERVCEKIISELYTQGLTDTLTAESELQAYKVNDRIRDADIRNLHILYAIS